jgi:hypothetical protein
MVGFTKQRPLACAWVPPAWFVRGAAPSRALPALGFELGDIFIFDQVCPEAGHKYLSRPEAGLICCAAASRPGGEGRPRRGASAAAPRARSVLKYAWPTRSSSRTKARCSV